MMSNKIKFLLGLMMVGMLSLGSCKESKPVGVISEDTIKMILMDLYEYEGATYVENLSMGDSAKIPGYNAILAKYGVTISDFDSSMFYYAKTNMPKLKFLHKEVVDQLEQLKVDIKNSEE